MQESSQSNTSTDGNRANSGGASRLETFVDLFCGIGGFHYAAADFGLRCVFACDIDEAARRQYELNFHIEPYGDICEIREHNVPRHDILFAGFPCQPFSIIGARGGMDDERGTLMFEIVRILRFSRPSVLILENVRQFSTMQKGSVLKKCIDAISELGYSCEWKVLNALDFSLPQKRERTIIVGFLDHNSHEHFKWPQKQTDCTPLSDILEKRPKAKYFASDRIRKKRLAQHRTDVKPAIWHENKGGNVSSHPFSCALRAGASYNYLLVNGERRLTPREQLRLQGFPESFSILGNDSQLRKQVGNAVPVPMIRAVIGEVLSATTSAARRLSKERTLSA